MGAGCSSDGTNGVDHKFNGIAPTIKPAGQTDTRQTAVVDTHKESFAAAKGEKYAKFNEACQERRDLSVVLSVVIRTRIAAIQ